MAGARKRKKRRPSRPANTATRAAKAAPGTEGPRAPARENRASHEARPSRNPRGGKRPSPPAPWGSFPLVELIVLLSLGMLVTGFIVQGGRGATLIAAGVALGFLAGLELSIREHFSGHKSHSTALAGAVTVLALALGFFLLGLSGVPNLALGGVVFAASFYALREAFKRRSGGFGFRA